MTLHTIGRKAPILLLVAGIVAAAASTQTALASRLPLRIDLSSRAEVASQLADGTVLTLNRASRLQQFNADGELVKSLGIIGAGKNKSLRWLGTCGTTDAAYVLDGNASTLITIKGGSTTTTNVEDGRLVNKAACANPTTFVVADWPAEALDSDNPIGPYRSTVDVRLNGHSLGTYKSDERFRYPRTDGPRPFGRQVLVAANTSRVFVGNSDTFTIDIFDLSGKRVGQINQPHTPRAFTAADRSAYLASIGEKDGVLWGMLLPERTFPAYDRFLTDSSGLWVEEPSVTDSVKTWHVFDNDGRQVQLVDVPANYELIQVSGGKMFGTWKGSQSMEQYTPTARPR